jgi:hypothetical protein
MSANSFVQRGLRATFILAGSGQVFPGTNTNTLTVSGLRISAQIQGTARLAAQMSLKVQGMKRVDMNAITVAWANPPVVLDHYVILEANNGQGWNKVFSGTIIEAQPEYRSQPDTFLQLLASVGYFQKIRPAESLSYTEAVDIDLVCTDIAALRGSNWKFVNGGVTGILNGPLYLNGTLLDQLDTACQAAGCDYYLANDTITVTPRGRPIENTAPAVVLSPTSGMIGYPVYERAGLNVQALYQPAFDNGVPLDIKDSVVAAANGRWYPYSVVHELDGNIPQGKWNTSMKCLRVGV